jgi:hypothetical protein
MLPPGRQAKDKAEHASDEAIRCDYLALERRWLKLAQSYELLQRVAVFNDEVTRRIAVFLPPKPPHPALPLRSCAACGKTMRLTQIAPSAEGPGQDMTLRCDCGHQLTQPYTDEA